MSSISPSGGRRDAAAESEAAAAAAREAVAAPAAAPLEALAASASAAAEEPDEDEDAVDGWGGGGGCAKTRACSGFKTLLDVAAGTADRGTRGLADADADAADDDDDDDDDGPPAAPAAAGPELCGWADATELELEPPPAPKRRGSSAISDRNGGAAGFTAAAAVGAAAGIPAGATARPVSPLPEKPVPATVLAAAEEAALPPVAHAGAMLGRPEADEVLLRGTAGAGPTPALEPAGRCALPPTIAP